MPLQWYEAACEVYPCHCRGHRLWVPWPLSSYSDYLQRADANGRPLVKALFAAFILLYTSGNGR